MEEKIKIAGIVPESIVDGVGMRTVVFFQGCSHHCAGCHNPQTWDFAGGTEYTPRELAREVAKVMTPLHRGLTLSGGDPLEQPRQVQAFLEEYRKLRPAGDVWCYTGFVWDEVKTLPVLRLIDVLVDGPFINARRDLQLAFRGSTNQRVIDVRQSLAQDRVIVLDL